MHVVYLRRTYHGRGTNGTFYWQGVPICQSIELPWRHNVPQLSCIPEGNYLLRKRYSEHFHWHLHLQDVPGRSLILIHPANNALLELKGCIAPVITCTGEGQGISSRSALALLTGILFPLLEQAQPVYLTIHSKEL